MHKMTMFLACLAVCAAATSAADETVIEGPYTEDSPLDLTVSSGTVKLTGDERIVLGDVLVTATSASNRGTLLIQDAREVIFTNQMINVGTREGDLSNKNWWPRLVVSNSFFGSTVLSSKGNEGSLNIGRAMDGILEVLDGAVVSNKFYVGGGANASPGYEGKADSSRGAVYQRGGVVYALGNGSDGIKNSTIGLTLGLGFYSLEGGELRALNRMTIGVFTRGILMQTGGFLSAKEAFYVCGGNGGDAVYCQMGGTSVFSNVLWVAYTSTVGKGVLSVIGPGTLFREDHDSYGGVIHISNAKTSVARINVNDGGVLECGGINVFHKDDDYTTPFANLMNVDGGIIRVRAKYCWPRFFGGALPEGSRPLDRIAVYGKGMTMDTNGKSVETFAPIIGVKEGGISAINLSAPISSIYAAPKVNITGDGHGATAVALLDTVNNCITNVLITSRGWGYTKAATTIKLEYNQYGVIKTFTSDEFEVADTDAGGFTKMGAGTLTLSAGVTNEWKKWTRVYGGTLKVGADYGLPSNTVVTLKNGAVLDMNHTASQVDEVLYGRGGGSIENAENATVPESAGYVVDVDEVLLGQTTEIPDGTDLSTTKLLLRGDLDALLANRGRYPLFTAAGGSFTGAPTVVADTPIPSGWHCYVRGATIWLAPESGFMILVQ